jgi:Tol biopolymer transport system component
VHWLDGTGRDIPLITKAGEYRYPRLSPDGRRLILTVTEGTDQDIWIYDLERGTRERLTNGGVNTAPTWSPDGKYVVFAALGGLFWTKAQSTHSAPQRFAESTLPRHVWSFAPDGRTLAFQQGFGGEQYDIGLLTVANDGAGLQAGPAKMVIQSRFTERAPALSPDGRWLAYQSNESGRDQVYVCALPCSGEKWQVSIDSEC